MRALISTMLAMFFWLCFPVLASDPLGPGAAAPQPLSGNYHAIGSNPWLPCEGPGFPELESLGTPLEAFYRIPTVTPAGTLTQIEADLELLRKSKSVPTPFLLLLADIIKLIESALYNIP